MFLELGAALKTEFMRRLIPFFIPVSYLLHTKLTHGDNFAPLWHHFQNPYARHELYQQANTTHSLSSWQFHRYESCCFVAINLRVTESKHKPNQAGGAPCGELHLQLISENLNKPHSCCVWWSGGSCSHKPLARPHTSNGLVIEIHYMLPPPNKPASFLKFPTVGRWSAMCLTGRKWHTRFWKWYAESVQPGFSYCCDLLHKRHVRSVFLKFHGSTGQESKAGK